MSDVRERLLRATIKIFAEAGYHGTTTRRVAQVAGVNEVTLFRHFGSKDMLIREALEAVRCLGPRLDTGAADPAAELHRWAHAVFTKLYEHKDLIRRVMAETLEWPDLAPVVSRDTNEEFAQLVRFFEALRARGNADPDLDPVAAAGLLLGVLVSHALWRDLCTEPPPLTESVDRYVELVLRATGVTDTSAGPSRGIST